MKIETKKLASIRDRPNILVLYLPSDYVKESGFRPDQKVQVIFGDKEIKIVDDIKKVEV